MKAKENFRLLDLIIISMLAALGIAVKTVLVPLVQIITGPLFIPGGAIAGGVYMLFVVLAAMIVRKPGAAFLVCLIQTILVTVTGTMGSHGIMSLLTYLLPGICVEALYLLLGSFKYSKVGCFLGGIAANVSGTFLVNFVFFRLPLIPLLLTLCLGALSGGIGGLIAYSLSKQVEKINMGKDEDVNLDIDITKSGDPNLEKEENK